MKNPVFRLGACCATMFLFACDTDALSLKSDGGRDAPVVRLDAWPPGPDTRPGTILPVPGPDAADLVGPGAIPVTPAPDAPVVPGQRSDARLPAPNPDGGGAACGLIGAACTTAADCCGTACIAGACTANACLSDGAACTGGGQCCSSTCTAGTCATLNPTCKTAGNACKTGSECCNGVCDQNQCAQPGQVSYCSQVGDVCRADAECCTGVCNVGSGATVGTCASISTSCLVDGTVCNGCGSCCSHFCGPFGAGGPDICQPASGCHVQGDLCHSDSDCCGGDPRSGMPGAGLVKCEPDPVYGSRIGTCGGPRASNCPDGTDTCKNSCNPEGNVCHWLDTGVCEGATTSKRNDCCACISGKECCKLDRTGIPRCNALAACVPAGGSCAFSGDCCDNLPCVPDPVTGRLTCGSKCVPLGGLCTTNADCCIGTLCQVPPGSLAGTCTIPSTPPPRSDAGVPIADGSPPPIGSDAGTLPGPDAGPPPVCAYFGQACSVEVTCCGGIPCVNIDYLPCTAADGDCICNSPE